MGGLGVPYKVGSGCLYKLIFESTKITKGVLFLQDNALARRALVTQKKIPATGQLDTGFSWIPCVYKQMLRWFPTFQVASTCFSCLTLLNPYFIFMYMHYNHCHLVTTQLQLKSIVIISIIVIIKLVHLGFQCLITHPILRI